MDKLQVKKYHVMGTSYGGFVAYHMAKLWPEKVEKVVIASSGVNMRKADNMELLQRANVETVEEIMLPGTAAQLRTLTCLAISRRLTMVPDFFWNDVVNVSLFPFSILVTISFSTLFPLFTKIEFDFFDSRQKKKKDTWGLNNLY